jgi:hypothetical protein
MRRLDSASWLSRALDTGKDLARARRRVESRSLSDLDTAHQLYDVQSLYSVHGKVKALR